MQVHYQLPYRWRLEYEIVDGHWYFILYDRWDRVRGMRDTSNGLNVQTAVGMLQRIAMDGRWNDALPKYYWEQKESGVINRDKVVV